MNFLSLEYFIAVAEDLNITKAAERLFISQQSLSKHIIKLEHSLDTQLFERTPCMSLTYAGKRFLRAAVQMLDIRRQIVTEIDDINNRIRGELRIGISYTRGRVLLPQVLPAFTKTHPLVEIIIREGNSKELEDLLLHGQIDLLIGFSPIVLDIAQTVDILQERLLIIVPRQFLIDLFPDSYEAKIRAYEKAVDLKAFEDCPFLMLTSGNRIRTLFDQYIDQHDIHVNILLEMENIETLLSLACEGMGISLYPEMFANHLSPLIYNAPVAPVHLFPLDDPSTYGHLVIAYHRERYLPEAARDFIAECVAKGLRML
ncbi:MAG TPA: LysR family transcriptional regulator [Candidatus Limiplasma sp.]|nr:LysR family transcriptional regulator [Candidatus Limiplasma sp.]